MTVKQIKEVYKELDKACAALINAEIILKSSNEEEIVHTISALDEMIQEIQITKGIIQKVIK